MRIGINTLPFLPGVSGGIELYTRNLICGLSRVDRNNEYIVFSNPRNGAVFRQKHENFRCWEVPVRSRPQALRIAGEQTILPILSAKIGLDVLHSPGYTCPLVSTIPNVVTVCDMLYKVYPEYIGRAKLAYWRLFVPLSVRRSRRILTLSEASKCDIVRYLNVPVEKVVVTPLAVDDRLRNPSAMGMDVIRQVLDKHQVNSPYILSVGAVGPHKNPLVLVEALARLREFPETADLSLVITGNDYGSRQEILSRARDLGVASALRLLGYVAAEDLPCLYRSASVYVSLSHFEGFGLTVLEAMELGVPVVASDRCSLPEVAGDGAVLVSPEDVDTVTRAIARLVSDRDYRRDLVARAARQSKKFSWERTALLTLEAYRAAAGL